MVVVCFVLNVSARADHSSRGVLPSVVCLSVCVESGNMNNEAAWARVGLLRQREENHVITSLYFIQRRYVALLIFSAPVMKHFFNPFLRLIKPPVTK